MRLYTSGCISGFGGSAGSFYRGLLGDLRAILRLYWVAFGYPPQGYNLTGTTQDSRIVSIGASGADFKSH